MPEYVIRYARLRNPDDADSRCLETSSTRRDTPMTSAETFEYAQNTSFAKNFGIPL
ncbi:MAG: hypothetical protein ACR2G7_05155 [Acidimicrobiales bacterium]